MGGMWDLTGSTLMGKRSVGTTPSSMGWAGSRGGEGSHRGFPVLGDPIVTSLPQDSQNPPSETPKNAQDPLTYPITSNSPKFTLGTK